MIPIRPLAGHAVFLLLVELALLILVARIGAELSKRLGLPAVVGELGAGIVLGPTVFGHFAPGAFAALFPPNAEQFHLLDVVGTLGMTFLLLLTGLETDLKLLRNLGRAALMTSATGMLVPFALGFALGYYMPESYLVDPSQRMLFSVFLATAMSISAMPVIAKILVDLDLTKRNIGLVILSAGVVDDTAGWLILSIIAGVATQGRIRVADFALMMLYLLAFVLAVAFVLYPILRYLLRVTAERWRTPDTDLVIIVVTTFLCAATTEAIGVHAVFGAFAAGIAIHQVPRLRKETVHRLESFVFSVLAPVFFGIVGLKVNLWTLGGGQMLGLVLGVACLGKLVGCSLGAAWGGMRFWEGASLAVAMNARGAMEIVVATIGLSLGILSPQMFSIIVMVAIITSFMAPIGLRLTLPRVRVTADEQQRMLAAKATGLIDRFHASVLLPTGGGPNALVAAPIAFGLTRESTAPVKILLVEPKINWRRRLARALKGGPVTDLAQHLDSLRAMAAGKVAPEVRKVVALDVAAAIRDEAAHGVDIVLIGSAGLSGIGGSLIEQVVAGAPCHVAIMRATVPRPSYRSIFVPVDGSVASRLAVEFAHRYAENTGAELTLAVLTERRPQAAAYADQSGTYAGAEMRPTTDEDLERISVVFRASSLKPRVLPLVYDPLSSAVMSEVQTGRYDLVVLGAENRAIQHRLFFGYDNERLIRATRVPVIVVVPNVAKLTVS